MEPQYLRSCCALYSAILLACPKKPITSPDRGNGERQPATTVIFAPRTPSRPQDIVRRLPNRRIYVLSHAQELLAGLDSTWEDRLMMWALVVRSALEQGEVLPLLPTAAWTLGFQNVFEAGNALPPSPTAAVTPEGTDPALDSDPLVAGVTPPEGAAPASEGDSRVRGQAEPGDAACVAAANFLMAGERDVTVPGRLPPPLRQPAPPQRGEGHGRGNGPSTGERPFSSGSDTPGSCSSSVRRRPGEKGAGGARRC